MFTSVKAARIAAISTLVVIAGNTAVPAWESSATNRVLRSVFWSQQLLGLLQEKASVVLQMPCWLLQHEVKPIIFMSSGLKTSR